MSIQIHYSIHQNLLFTRFFSNYTIFCFHFTHRILSTSKNSSVQVINSSIHYIRILHTILPKLYFSLIQGFSTFVKPSNYNTISCLFKFICIYSSHDSFQIIPFSIPVNIQESLNSQEKFQIIIFRHSISSISYILNPRNSPNRNTTSCLFKFISSPLRSSSRHSRIHNLRRPVGIEQFVARWIVSLTTLGVDIVAGIQSKCRWRGIGWADKHAQGVAPGE